MGSHASLQHQSGWAASLLCFVRACVQSSKRRSACCPLGAQRDAPTSLHACYTKRLALLPSGRSGSARIDRAEQCQVRRRGRGCPSAMVGDGRHDRRLARNAALVLFPTPIVQAEHVPHLVSQHRLQRNTRIHLSLVAEPAERHGVDLDVRFGDGAFAIGRPRAPLECDRRFRQGPWIVAATRRLSGSTPHGGKHRDRAPPVGRCCIHTAAGRSHADLGTRAGRTPARCSCLGGAEEKRPFGLW